MSFQIRPAIACQPISPHLGKVNVSNNKSQATKENNKREDFGQFKKFKTAY